MTIPTQPVQPEPFIATKQRNSHYVYTQISIVCVCVGRFNALSQKSV